MTLHFVSHELIPFSYVTDIESGRLSMSLHGEFDFACVDLLSSVPAESDAGLHEVVVDLADLAFIDTAGVHALEEVRRRNECEGRTVVLTKSTPMVRRVFTLLGREDLLLAA